VKAAVAVCLLIAQIDYFLSGFDNLTHLLLTW
jgi:hypothetical protein